MMMFRHPTTTLLVDDDQAFLESFTYYYGKVFQCRSCDRPEEALKFLERSDAAWQRHVSLTSRARADADDASHTVRVKHRPLRDIAVDVNRQDTCAVAIVDYSMPSMSGLDLCRALDRFPVRKILLTGQVGEQTAVAAFNEGLIDSFLVKQDPDLLHRLPEAVFRLQHRFFEEASKSLSILAQSHAMRFLSVPMICNHISSMLDFDNVTEYYAWDTPAGVVTRDRYGRIKAALVQDADTARAQVEIAEASNAPDDVIQLLRRSDQLGYFPTPDGFFDAHVFMQAAPTRYIHGCQILAGGWKIAILDQRALETANYFNCLLVPVVS